MLHTFVLLGGYGFKKFQIGCWVRLVLELRWPEGGGIVSVSSLTVINYRCGMAAAVDIWDERTEGEWEQKRWLILKSYLVVCEQDL